jgi:serine/threonine-protein kinase
MSLPRPPREIADRYRLERILKSGPQATVLRAIDTEAGRPVVVKLLNPGSDPAGIDRFGVFAAALEEIETATIPAVSDWGFTTDGFAFLVFELIDGRSFAGLAGTSHRRIASLATQALGGLEALAARGVAHGNLSPENLLVEIPPGSVGQRLRLAGLGTACFRRGGVRDTSPGARFRAPEEAAGGPPTLRGDLFGLARSLAEVLGAEIAEPDGPAPRVTLPFSFEIERTDLLQNVLASCLRANPAERPGSADEVRRALRSALGKGFESEPAWTPRPRVLPKPQPEIVEPAAAPQAPMPLLSAIDVDADDNEALLDKTQPVQARPLPEPQAKPAPSAIPVPEAPKIPAPMPAPQSPPPVPLAVPPPPPPALANPSVVAPPPSPIPPAIESAPGDGREAPTGSLLPEIDFDALGPPAALGNYTPSPTPIPAAVAAAAAAGAAAAASPTPPPQTGGPFRAAAVAQKRKLVVPRWAWAAGGGVLLLAVGWLAWRLLPKFLPAPEPAPVAAPVAPPQPVKDPPAVRLEAAQRALADGDYGRAHELLASLDVADQAALGPQGCIKLQVLAETIPKIAAEQLPADLANGLETGSIELLRRILAAVPDPAALPDTGPAFAADLARAREIVRMFSEVETASAAGHPAEVLERFAPLAVLLPEDSPAFVLRERAAEAIERQAEAHAQNGEYPQAQADLSPLLNQWPNRSGLRERIAEYQKAQGLEASQEAFLANVPRYLSRRRPDEGLEELRKYQPTPHLAKRFAEAQKSLTDLLSRLDANPPEVEASGDTRFFRGTVATLSFSVRDDFQVANVEIFAGNRRVKAEKIGRLRYEVEIPPSIHRNEAIDVVAVATDVSGHETRASVRLTRVGSTERLVR